MDKMQRGAFEENILSRFEVWIVQHWSDASSLMKEIMIDCRHRLIMRLQAIQIKEFDNAS